MRKSKSDFIGMQPIRWIHIFIVRNQWPDLLNYSRLYFHYSLSHIVWVQCVKLALGIDNARQVELRVAGDDITVSKVTDSLGRKQETRLINKF